MIEINLIPDVKQELLKAQRQRSIVISSSIIASIAAVGIVVLLCVLIFGVQGIRNVYLDGQINDKGAELSEVEDLSKILTIQNQLKSISSLNDQKKMSSRMFDMIAAITPQNDNSVAFSQVNLSLAGDSATATDGTDATATDTETPKGGNIQLEGQTASYESMEIFKKTIANTIVEYKFNGETKTMPLATNIGTGDVSFGEDVNGNKVLRFNIGFDYDGYLLSPKSTNLIFRLNVNGNVTDSFLGIPRFTERAKDLGGDN